MRGFEDWYERNLGELYDQYTDYMVQNHGDTVTERVCGLVHEKYKGQWDDQFTEWCRNRYIDMAEAEAEAAQDRRMER